MSHQAKCLHQFVSFMDSVPFDVSNLRDLNIEVKLGDFPGGAVIKNPPANAGDTGSSPGPGRSHMPRSN